MTVLLSTLGQNCWLDTTRTTVVTEYYGQFTKIYKRVWRYPGMSIPSETDTVQPSTHRREYFIGWNSTMKPFVLPKQLLWLM